MRQKMSLQDWIDKTGASQVAKLLKINRTTVYYWRAGHTYPRVDQMRQIKKVTKGVVGYEQIIDGRSH